jgi:RimJ/RimL family protein N-acetyltransferase
MSPAPLPSPVALESRFVRLEPYEAALRPEVQAALDGDLDAWLLFSRPGFGPHFATWWAQAEESAAAGAAQHYAVRRLADGRVVGTTSFLNLRPLDRGVEIGATFLHADARASLVNPAIKRLMLAHALDGGLFGAPAHRVELMIDARNLRSQAAVAKLGAVREGVLRNHKITWTGHLRDTVVFSFTPEDWPAVRDRLDMRLSAAARA